MADFDTVARTLGSVKSETRFVAREIFNAAANAGHEIHAMWGYDPNAGNPEHHSGLAIDFMVRNKAAGDWIKAYVWANRARLRLRHVIWWQRITSTVTQPGVTREMANRGNSTANHKDHPHVLILPGGYQPPSGGTGVPPVGGKTVSQLATEVIRGDWDNGDERRRRLTDAGYNYDAVQAEVERQLGAPSTPPRKSVSEIATEVLNGEWGNGADRIGRLNDAGYNASEVQAEVNRRYNSSGGGKSISQLASEVLRGEWGNDPERSRRLRAKGYDAAAVQREVNRRS